MKEARKVVCGGRIKRAGQEALRGGSACKKAAIKRPRSPGRRRTTTKAPPSHVPPLPLALPPHTPLPLPFTLLLAPAYAHVPPPPDVSTLSSPHALLPYPHSSAPRPHLHLPRPHLHLPRPHLHLTRPHRHKEGSGEALIGWHRKENEERVALLSTLLTAPLTARHGATCDKRWGGSR